MDVPTEGQRANGIVRYASDVCTTKTQRVIARYAVGKMDVPTEGQKRQRRAAPGFSRGVGGHKATQCGNMRYAPGRWAQCNAMRHDAATRTSDDCAIVHISTTGIFIHGSIINNEKRRIEREPR